MTRMDSLTGERYSHHANAKDRAAWKVVAEHLPSKTEKQCTQIIAAWVESASSTRTNIRTQKGRSAQGLRLDLKQATRFAGGDRPMMSSARLQFYTAKFPEQLPGPPF